MKTIIICINHRANPNQPSCGDRGSVKVADCLETEVSRNHYDIRIERFNCLGFCDRGPNLKIMPDGRFLHEVKLADIPGLLSKLSTKPE